MFEKLQEVTLRFGIQPLQFEEVMHAIVLRGKAYLEKFNYAEMCKLATKTGFMHIELLADVSYIIPGSFKNEVMDELLKMKEQGVTFSIHLPIWSIELSSPNEYIRKGSIECLIQSIKALEV